MENEFELNLNDLDQIESNVDNKLKVKNRFQDLSEKVKLNAQAKDEAETKLKVEADARAKAEKELGFYKDFSSKSAQYPGASEYQDRIFEKVQNGYETEDAILAVLGREGKLSNTPPPQQEITRPNVAGGSAQTNLGDGGNKDLSSMSSDDKLAALLEAEKRGDISL